MGGGLLNLVAYGNKNVIVNGNPTTDLFKTTYAKYTNFGMQKFQINFDGQRSLRLLTDSIYIFSINRYADMLMDTCFTIDVPHIWSPMYINQDATLGIQQYDVSDSGSLATQPYEFKWIQNLGFQMIRTIVFKIGGQIIQQYSGQYLYNMIKRDYPEEKKDLLDKMTGNTPDLNDPANYLNRHGNYPTAFTPDNVSWSAGGEPSIRGRKLYIPFNIWLLINSNLAFPLTALNFNLLEIEITCRSIRELFVIRDINQYLTNNFDPITGALVTPYVKPQYISTFNTVDPKFQMAIFLQQPPATGIQALISWTNQATTNPYNTWYANPYLMCTYAFLDPEEVRIIVAKPQSYLFREINEELTQNMQRDFGRLRFDAPSGMVRSIMWFFQRNDVQLRNEWSNYTNWPYDYLPYPCIAMQDALQNQLLTMPYAEQPQATAWCGLLSCDCSCGVYCPSGGLLQPPYTPLRVYNADISTNFDSSGNFLPGAYQYPHITGPNHVANRRDIMTKWSLLLDGQIRESEFDAGVWNLTEKYVRTSGNADMGLYCYNFCLNTNHSTYQPNGAMNFTPFRKIGFDYSTILPPVDPGVAQYIICDNNNNAVGINKINWQLYKYNYDLYIMIERYNYITFENGNYKLKFSNV